jgi:hypothetical protein
MNEELNFAPFKFQELSSAESGFEFEEEFVRLVLGQDFASRSPRGRRQR